MSKLQHNQTYPTRLYSCEDPTLSIAYAPNVVLLRNLANLAVALVAVIGSGNAEIPATQTLIIRGSMVHMPVNVSTRELASDLMCAQ